MSRIKAHSFFQILNLVKKFPVMSIIQNNAKCNIMKKHGEQRRGEEKGELQNIHWDRWKRCYDMVFMLCPCFSSEEAPQSFLFRNVTTMPLRFHFCK